MSLSSSSKTHCFSNGQHCPTAIETAKTSSSADPPVSSVASHGPSPAPHHLQEPLCLSRPRYRQGRQLTAIKVYTISEESVYLLVNGVPALRLQRELRDLCQRFGRLRCLTVLEQYPSEAFVEVYLIKYASVREARIAKRHLDGRNFFGGVFHVCYAPELEEVDETRKKLEERKRAVEIVLNKNNASISIKKAEGSVLSMYHPDDKLSASVKRVMERLGNKKLKFNDNNGTYDSVNHNCDSAGTSSKLCPDTSTDNNYFQPFNYIGNDYHDVESGPASTLSNTVTTSTWTNRDQNSSEISCSSISSKHNDRSDSNTFSTDVFDYTSLSMAPVGTIYGSMKSTFEEGLGDVSGEQYTNPGTSAAHCKEQKTLYIINKPRGKHKRSSKHLHRKSKVPSLSTSSMLGLACKRNLDRQGSLISGPPRCTVPVFASNTKYSHVIKSMRAQQDHKAATLERLQHIMKEALPKPASVLDVRPAPDRPIQKMLHLQDGVKLL